MAALLRRGGLRLASRLPSLAEAATAQAGCSQASSSAPAVWVQCAKLTTSQAAAAPVHIEEEPYCRQRQLIIIGNRVPTTAPDTWLASNAVVIGDVDLYERVSIWYGCVLRGDLNSIRVGAFSNVQDRTVIHAARSSPTGLPAATQIGNYVTIGPACMLRSCIVEDEVVIGERSVLLEGSMVEKNAVLAPGSVVPPGRRIPSGQLWAGNPARYVRDLSKDEKLSIKAFAESIYPAVDRNAEVQMEETLAYVEAEEIKEKLAAFPVYADFVAATPISEAGAAGGPVPAPQRYG